MCLLILLFGLFNLDAEIQKLFQKLDKMMVSPTRILHSDKLRAQQTAQLLQQILSDSIPLESSDIIKPKSSVLDFSQILANKNQDLAIVSHLPFLNNLVSYLLCGSEERLTIRYIPGSVVCMEQDEEQQWGLTWMIRPEMLID